MSMRPYAIVSDGQARDRGDRGQISLTRQTPICSFMVCHFGLHRHFNNLKYDPDKMARPARNASPGAGEVIKVTFGPLVFLPFNRLRVPFACSNEVAQA